MKRLFLVFVVAVSCFSTLTFAKSARCFTTDDGYFPCQFKTTDRAGSFEIRSNYDEGLGYAIIVEEPGFASGFAIIGGRSIAVGGMFVRQRDDGACWNNPELNVKVCAW